jgi:putative endopeptidase
MSWTARLGFIGLVLAMVMLPLGFSGQSPNSRVVAAVSVEIGGCTSAFADSPAIEAHHGFDLANLDRSASPCTDFYQFASGGWMNSHPIPAAYPSWGSFNVLRDHNDEILHTILERAAKNSNAARGSAEQKIGDFYANCMNTEQIEAQGIKPLGPELERIAAIKSVADLQAEAARLQSEGVNAFFEFGSQQDFKNSTQEIAAAEQGGLGLPDRDYYTKTDDRSKELRDGYVQHVGKMFGLLGDAPESASAEAKTVVAIETKMAEASMSRVDRRDPDKIYHKLELAQLKELTPDFSWPAYFREVGYGSIQVVDVAQPEFFKALNAQLASVPLADWKTYLRWHLVHAAAPALPAKFVDENFNFYGHTLTGTTEILPRWKRCVQATDRELGEALGEIYVKDNFPPEAKAAALKMVHNLIDALREDLSTLDWMSPETRKQATAKLEAIMLKIGYPDKWRDYSAFQVGRGPYVENVWRGRVFDFKFDLSKIGKPVDRTEWGMTPPTVNAYYNPLMNEIVFPAGILQPPFYDPKADDAVNYGGIGSVIGHEMTHGFDDQGSKFDPQGNLRDWWTPEDLKSFQARAECVQKQFDSYVVEEGLHENGKLVEGESIADLGGLVIAHAAFEKTAEAKAASEKIDGFTPEQRFFLAWAQIWENNTRPEFARLLVNTNPHPLGRFRAIGPVANIPAFAQAFGCKGGDSMVRPANERCRIW